MNLNKKLLAVLYDAQDLISLSYDHNPNSKEFLKALKELESSLIQLGKDQPNLLKDVYND